MKNAAYARVSSRSQDVATQVDAIEQAAKARGDVIETWYLEKRSGGKLARPLLDRLRERVRLGQHSKVYVFRLDRLTRSGIRDTLSVVEELRSNGCRVLSVADGFDLEGPAGEIIMAVMAWAAQMERLAIGERIAAARKRVEAAGGRWGRPSRVDGELAARIRAAKGSVRVLAARFKVPRSTVAAVLSEKGPYRPVAKKPKKKGARTR